MEAAAAKISEVAAAQAERDESRPYLTALPGSWPWTVAFMLSLAAFGLSFYPAVLPLIFIMARSWRHSRYDFLIQLVLVIGGYAYIGPVVTGINFGYFAMMLGGMCAFLLRKTPVMKKLVGAWCVYALILLVLVVYNDESFRIQSKIWMSYVAFIFFMVPPVAFAGQKFSYDSFVRSVFPYAMICCVFYILDGFVFCGFVFVPQSFSWNGFSTFNSLNWMPFSGNFIRKYPPGLYFLALLIFPLARQYRLRVWQWGVVLLAMAATQTFTFLTGLVLIYMCFQSSVRKAAAYVGLAVVGGVALYFVDGSMGAYNYNGDFVTPMRIYSSVQQFVDLSNAADDVDLAEFGSGRLAQAIPNLELLYKLGYQWHGLGFLDKFETDCPKYIVQSDYVKDWSFDLFVAGDIEIIVLRVFVAIGWIGLFVHILYFAYNYWVVRRLKYSTYFLSVMLFFVFIGMGGFEGLITCQSQLFVALALAVPVLTAKNKDDEH